MTDLTKLYDDWIDKRLAWQTIRREKEEILLKGIVDEIEALKGRSHYDALMSPQIPGKAELNELAAELGKIARKPGRPPKVEAA